MSIEREFSRRQIIGAAGASLLLLGCENVFASKPQVVEKAEAEVPKMGAIVVYNNQSELLRNGMRYQVRDRELYLRLSGTKGKVFSMSESEAKSFLAKYPQGKVDNNFQVSIGQGDIKRLNPDGGRKLVFAQGLLSSDSRPYLQIIPREDTFVAARKKLKEYGWDPDPTDPRLREKLFLDSYIFTCNENELAKFSIQDTLRPLRENNDNASKFIKKISERNPFEQIDGMGHSLGGLWILKMAMERPEAFNSLVFINSPIMGLNLNLLKKGTLGLFEKQISDLGVDPTRVIKDLSELWTDEYHKKVKNDLKDFAKRGGKVLIVATEGDKFVSREDTGIDEFKNIDGITTLTVNAGNVNPFNPFEVFSAHGLALSDSRVLDLIAQITGKNSVA